MSQLRFAAVKYASLVIGAAGGILQPFILSRTTTGHDLAFLLLILGLANYLAIADLGAGKPVYVRARQLYFSENKSDLSGYLNQFLSFFCTVEISCIFLFAAFVAAMTIQVETSYSIVFGAIFGIAISQNATLTILKNAT